MTRRKIKILDDNDLRARLDTLYEQQTQATLVTWAIALAKHIIELTNLTVDNYPAIAEAFTISEQAVRGEIRVYDVRQAGFAIHRIAKNQPSELASTVFRVIGQAVATAHMHEHAMVASDYAIKVINLLAPDNLEAVQQEREHQITQLTELSQ